MAVLTQLATSTMYVWQQVNADVDPTSDAVQMAFVPQPQYGAPPDPTEDQWNAAIWGNLPVAGYWAGCLVGPANGGLVLAQGAYAIAVKVVDNPEVPEMWGWNLLIT